MLCVATAGGHYSYSTTALGLKSKRSLPGILPPVLDPSEPVSPIQPGSFPFEMLPSERCLLLASITRTWLLLLGGRSWEYGRGRGAESAGEVRVQQGRAKGVASGAASQGLLLESGPRCHSPQLLPIIRCMHFLSKPNNKKEETHTTRSFISLSPPLQIFRLIFLN